LSASGFSSLHILHLSATGALGGAERCLLDILASVRQANPEWRLSVVTGADGGLVPAAKALGAEAHVVPYGESLARLGEAGRSGERFGAAALAGRLAWSAGPAMQYVVELGGLIDDLRPDVIHTHGLKMHILAAWAARTGRVAADGPRVVWHVHDYVGTRPATARFLRWSLRYCDAIVANSSSVAADVEATLHPSIPVVAIQNAVDLRRFSPSGRCLDLDRLAELPPAPSGTVRVGLIGTFGRWKGHTTFLDAIAHLGSAAAVRAYVIGGALYHTTGSQFSLEELRVYAERKGLLGRIGFTGFVDAADEAIRALDIVVHASTAPEPFGLVIAEAMACGRAVIASDAGGAREIFTRGVDALAHPPGNGEVLAQCISRLADDPSLRQQLGLAARQTAERRFNRCRLAAELEPLYRIPLRVASSSLRGSAPQTPQRALSRAATPARFRLRAKRFGETSP
jgi:glycosyltransferase involved in cell wall biosynthesis